jgi:hypothetical protein
MIIWYEGRDYPVPVQAGDVLFIAGKKYPCSKLPFEHVVIVAESRSIKAPEEFLDLPVYGMPESNQPGFTGIVLQNARFWFGHAALVYIGSGETVWNLGGRAPDTDETKAQEIAFILAQRAGSFQCRYAAAFNVDPTLLGPISTNCLGFVCSVLEHCDSRILEHQFPAYNSPYFGYKGPRDYPSPGHLARALHLKKLSLPWRPNNSRQARRYATAAITLAAARR